MTGESLGDRARPHTHTHKEPTVPSKFNTHSRDGFSTALVASAREGQNETDRCQCWWHGERKCGWVWPDFCAVHPNDEVTERKVWDD